jgi:hypothetical protein
VDFRESVRVIWPGEVGGVVARAVNLSPAGILVDAPTPTPCPVGSDVLCDVTLPRGQRLLRGRVAHRRVLTAQKVGMGIEFVDLSARERAELRDVVGDSAERPQRVKVRFEGTNQIVRARAYATPAGFQLATALPFLKAATQVDIALSPDESVNARGWVAGVSLDRTNADGVPRLLIDVQVADSADMAADFVPHEAKTPVVEPLANVPEYVWDAQELRELRDTPSIASPAALDAPVELANQVYVGTPVLPVHQTDSEEHVPTVVKLGTPVPTIVDGLASGPASLRDGDMTEVIPISPLPRRRLPSFGVGMLVGVGLLAVGGIVVFAARSGSKPAAAPVAVVAPVVAPPPPPVAVPPVEEPPVAAAPAAAVVDAEPAAPASAELFVGLKGSLAGARRYPLANPDGVAFNLPHARATMKLGTYPSPAPGLKSLWVRALPGGGTHLRFHFESATTAPRVELYEDGVHAFAR